MKKIGLIILAILVIGVIWFFFFQPKEKTLEEKGIIVTGCFSSNISKNKIDLENEKKQVIDISIKNNCTYDYKYYLVLSVKNKSDDDKLVSIKLNDNGEKTLTSYEVNTRFNVSTGYLNSYILDKGSLSVNKNTSYKIIISSNKKINWASEIKVVGAIS